MRRWKDYRKGRRAFKKDLMRCHPLHELRRGAAESAHPVAGIQKPFNGLPFQGRDSFARR